MPVESIETLKKLVKDQKLSAMSVDTSIFSQHQFVLDRYALRRLQQLKTSKIQYLMVDMIRKEIFWHVENKAKEHKAQAKKAIKNLTESWGMPAEKNEDIFSERFPESENEMTERRLAQFEQDTGAEILECSRQEIYAQVVERYFRIDPPFENKKTKKNEFPDAFALLTLESWAKENEIGVLVVSNDAGWRAYCEESKALYCIEKLPDALAVFHDDKWKLLEEICQKIERNGYPDIDSRILYFANEADFLDASGTASSNYEIEVVCTNVKVARVLKGLRDVVGGLQIVDDTDSVVVVKATLPMMIEATILVSFKEKENDKTRTSTVFSEMEKVVSTRRQVSFLLHFSKPLQDNNIEYAEFEYQHINVELGFVKPE